MTDKATPAQLIAKSVDDERSRVAKSWRGTTALLDCFGYPTLTPEYAERMQHALAEKGIRTDPPLSEADRRTKVRLLLPHDDPAAPQDLVGDGMLTATLWHAAERPRVIPVTEADRRPSGSFVWLDIEPAAEVSAAYAVLAPLLPGLEEVALADLLQVDDLPSTSTYGSVHKLSTVAIHAVEPQHGQRPDEQHHDEQGPDEHGPRKHARDEQSKAGALSILVVEMLVGPDWILTCWHEPRTTPVDAQPEDRDEVKRDALHAIEECWIQRADESLADLVLLLCREVARSYPVARRTLYSWLEQWELQFHRTQKPIEQATLRDLRTLISEMQRRLHALEETRLTVKEGNWLGGERTREIRQELEAGLDRATRGLTNLAGTLRTATELQTSAGIREQLAVAQEQARQNERQARQNERLQDQIGLVTSVLLVPTFIAGLFGANTAIPGQGHWSGFVLMVALMALGAGTAFALFRRIKAGSGEPSSDGS